MAGLSRAGILVVLTACGGGQRAGQSDSAAVSTGGAPMDTTAMAPSAAPADTTAMAPGAAAHDSSMTPTTAASDSGAKSTSAAAKRTATPKPAATTRAPTAQDTSNQAAAAQDTSKKTGASQDTSKKAAAAKPSAGGGGAQSPQQIALGDSIFHGQVGGGTCSACHGQDAKGTAVAPDLTDSQWLNGDGSYQFIVNTITNGVPKPKQHPAPMPPKGGAPLTDDQVKAVAAYEYSLSHKS
jgi:mono/diheme cytochrome c family protein